MSSFLHFGTHAVKEMWMTVLYTPRSVSEYSAVFRRPHGKGCTAEETRVTSLQRDPRFSRSKSRAWSVWLVCCHARVTDREWHGYTINSALLRHVLLRETLQLARTWRRRQCNEHRRSHIVSISKQAVSPLLVRCPSSPHNVMNLRIAPFARCPRPHNDHSRTTSGMLRFEPFNRGQSVSPRDRLFVQERATWTTGRSNYCTFHVIIVHGTSLP